ncbi:putative RING/U-box superfamily protein [Hibiscus syriacus]|uniref:RING/U-box superfamily protein n=1 Tax=Hibiscus syriacus TaxID=106335 RepID=A0A6A2XX64_HIBSY|nr:putative RING/U-box superfamily protein [Hibiscus syriacus]
MSCANKEDSGNAAIIAKNGGIELVCSICSKIPTESRQPLVSCLNTMSSLLTGIYILNSGFTVVAAAATGNEVVKRSFMELGIDELILQVLSGQTQGSVLSLYDAIRVLLISDDNHVVASEVYGYARRFAKIRTARAFVESLHGGNSSSGLVSACIALKAIAVNVSCSNCSRY